MNRKTISEVKYSIQKFEFFLFPETAYDAKTSCVAEENRCFDLYNTYASNHRG